MGKFQLGKTLDGEVFDFIEVLGFLFVCGIYNGFYFLVIVLLQLVGNHRSDSHM